MKGLLKSFAIVLLVLFSTKSFAQVLDDTSEKKASEERAANIQKIFEDVPVDHPYAEAILYAHSMGIVKGYADNTFRPEQNINRVEFLKIIVKSRYPVKEIASCKLDTLPFKDISTADWFLPFLCVGLKHGLISGYPDGTFHPEWPIRLPEGAKILVKAFGIPPEEVSKEAPWYVPFMIPLLEKAIIPPTLKKIEYFIRRGEMAEMIYRLQKGIYNKKTVDGRYLLGSYWQDYQEQKESGVQEVTNVISSEPTEGETPPPGADAFYRDGYYAVEVSFKNGRGSQRIRLEVLLQDQTLQALSLRPVVGDPVTITEVHELNLKAQKMVAKPIKEVNWSEVVDETDPLGKAFLEAFKNVLQEAQQHEKKDA